MKDKQNKESKKNLEIISYVPDQDYEKIQAHKKKIEKLIQAQNRRERSGRYLNVNEKTMKFIKFKELERLIIDSKKSNKKLYRYTLTIENLAGQIKVIFKKKYSPCPDIIEINIKSFQDIENIKKLK